MREIKFRAWMEDSNQDWYDEDNEDIYEMIYDFAYEEYDTVNDMLRKTDNLMQHTGLKDKSGVDIYEGDIIKCDIKHQNRKDVMGSLEWSGVTLFIKDEENIMLAFNLASDIEVIGNIYENPELLKVL